MPLRLWIGASVHWVPDGDSLFIRKFGDLYRVDLRTGDVALSEAFPPLTFSVTWSRDGRRMFYSVNDSDFQTGSVMVRDLATGREQTLYQGKVPYTLELSPDGRTLAFDVVEYSPKRVTLVLLPAEGGSIRELVTHADVADHPILGWTPDGSGIIFGRELGIQGAQGYAMWYISAQGGEPRRLEPTLNTWRPALHPDGRHFAFAVGEGRLELWALSNFLPLMPRITSST